MVTVGVQSAAGGALAVGEAMTGGVDLLGVAVAAGGAGVGGVAGGGAGGSSDLGGVLVTQSRNGLGVGVAALGAGKGLDALGSAGGSLGHLGGVAVAALGGGGSVADRDRAVSVLGEGEVDFHVAGNLHLLAAAFHEGAGGILGVGIGHEPLAVALGL